MTSISQFSFGYPTGQHIITNLNIQFSKEQKRVSLLGNNGVGKSSILREITMGLTRSIPGISLPIKTAYLSQDSWSATDFELSNIQESFYDLYFQKLTSHKYDQLAFDWWEQAITSVPKTYKQDLDRKLVEIGILQARLPQYFSQASPGTKKKILLAIMFATSPDLIVIDEISNHLDLQSIEVLKTWLNEYHGQLLFTEHNRAFLEEICRTFIYIPNNIERKAVNFPDSSLTDVYNSLADRSNQLNQKYDVLVKRKKQLNQAITLNQRIAKTSNSDRAGRQVRALKQKIDREVTNNSLFGEADIRKKVSFTKQNSGKQKIKKDLLLDIRDLQYRIGNHSQQMISEMKVYKGQRIRITGNNGSGKSTLLKLIQGEAQSQYIQGTIQHQLVLARDVFNFQQVQYYPSEYTIVDFVSIHLKRMEYEVDVLLRRIGLAKFSSSDSLHRLSLGEYIRLQFGILGEKLDQLQIIILDEPGNYLDMFTQKPLFDLLEQFQGSLLLVTHDDFLAGNISIDTTLELQ